MKSTVKPEVTEVIAKIELLPFFKNMNLATFNNIVWEFINNFSSVEKLEHLREKNIEEIFFYAHHTTTLNEVYPELNVVEIFNNEDWMNSFLYFCERLSQSEVKDSITFQEGDVVRHVGNPHYPMSVKSIISHDKSALCEWIDASGELQVRNIHFYSLVNSLPPDTISVYKLFRDDEELASSAISAGISTVEDLLRMGKNRNLLNCDIGYINSCLRVYGYQLSSD